MANEGSTAYNFPPRGEVCMLAGQQDAVTAQQSTEAVSAGGRGEKPGSLDVADKGVGMSPGGEQQQLVGEATQRECKTMQTEGPGEEQQPQDTEAVQRDTWSESTRSSDEVSGLDDMAEENSAESPEGEQPQMDSESMQRGTWDEGAENSDEVPGSDSGADGGDAEGPEGQQPQPDTVTVQWCPGTESAGCSNQMLVLAIGLSVGLLLLLFLSLMLMCYLRRRKKEKIQYQELLSTVPSVPACSAPVILVSQTSCTTPSEIPFTLPPRFITQLHRDLKNGEEEETEEGKLEAQRDILAHRGSLSVMSWYPVGTVLAGLYPAAPLNEVVAPPPGMATRLCFSVEYRHNSEQLVVSLFRLANLPPRFHSNITLMELRLLPHARRPRQAKARGMGPDPEFSDCFIFQVSGVCVHESTLSVCVLSVKQDGKRHAVGRVLFPLEGELGQAGRVLWRDLETEEDTQCSELGDMLISLSYSSSLQRLSVVVLRAQGLQLSTDAGVCVQVSLQMHTQVVKVKRSCVVKGENDPYFNYRMTFKLRPQHLDEACLRFELQQPNNVQTNKTKSKEPPTVLGVLVLGPFMYAQGPQLQHWIDMVNTSQGPVKLWHRLHKAT
ncbi:synaptotagmin-15 [Pholidichthys leucotaenia]